MARFLLLLCCLQISSLAGSAQPAIIAYYAGPSNRVDSFEVENRLLSEVR